MASESTYFVARPRGRAPGRPNDGLHVQLLWRPRDEGATVRVDDPRPGITFAGTVSRDRALDAFSHLFD